MSVKANQPQLLQDIQNLLARAGAGAGAGAGASASASASNPFRPAVVRALGEAPQWKLEQAHSLGLAHGRIERRTLRVLPLPLSHHGIWPGVRQVFEVERQITRKKSGKSSCEVVAGVTSLGPEQADAATLLELGRAHWGIENRSHWIRDVLWQEDQCRARTAALPQVLAAFRNLAMPLLRRIQPDNLAHAARKCAANPLKAFQLFFDD